MNTNIAFTPVTMLIVLIFLVTSVAMAAFFIFLWWRIFSKVGYSGALGLLILVPFGNLIVLCILAFSQWPIRRELDSKLLSENS